MMRSKPPQGRLLRIYLNDQLAGATAGVALVRRCCGSNQGSELGDYLATLLPQLEHERAVLRQVMDALGARVNWVKVAGATAAERVGRLKLNGRLVGYSDLSRLEELEILAGGLEIKRQSWLTLKEAASRHPEVAHWDFDELAERAAAQLDEIGPHHLHAASRAVGSSPKAVDQVAD